MKAFIMHVGHPGNVDIGYTVTRRRSLSELQAQLPVDAPERPYFSDAGEVSQAFPTGAFNCWGVPSLAEPSFDKTSVGDLVLFAPSIGIRGGIEQLGIVAAKCPARAHAASRVLWPDTPNDRLFPLLFFFDTEIGVRGWFDFLDDLGYAHNFNPRGWYRQIAADRFARWGDAEGYLDFLRARCDFRPLSQHGL
jgi:hypothetical protein